MSGDNIYEDLAMRVYWDCQELQTRLAEVSPEGRRAVVLSWLEAQDSKYPVIPEFKSEFTWYNVSSRVSLQRLAGSVTLLDFFTYCCINCLHILPDLARLEEKYQQNLTVVGVHSAKFDNERDGDHVRDAVARLDRNDITPDLPLSLDTPSIIQCVTTPPPSSGPPWGSPAGPPSSSCPPAAAQWPWPWGRARPGWWTSWSTGWWSCTVSGAS